MNDSQSPKAFSLPSAEPSYGYLPEGARDVRDTLNAFATGNYLEAQAKELTLTEAQRRYRNLSVSAELALENAQDDEEAHRYANNLEKEWLQTFFPQLPVLNSFLSNAISPDRTPLYGRAKLERMNALIQNPNLIVADEDRELLELLNAGDETAFLERGVALNRIEPLTTLDAERARAEAERERARERADSPYAPSVLGVHVGADLAALAPIDEADLERRVAEDRAEKLQALRGETYKRNFMALWATLAPSMSPIENELVRRMAERGQYGLEGVDGLSDFFNIYERVTTEFGASDEILEASNQGDMQALRNFSDFELYYTYQHKIANWDKDSEARMALMLNAARGNVIEDTAWYADIFNAAARGTDRLLRGTGEFAVGLGAHALDAMERVYNWSNGRETEGFYAKMSQTMADMARHKQIIGASVAHLGESEQGFVMRAATGLAEQIPIWASLALGRAPLFQTKSVVAPISAGSTYLAMSYAGDTARELQAQGVPTGVALAAGIISGGLQSAVENVQFKTAVGELRQGSLYHAFKASNESFFQWMAKETFDAGVDITHEMVEEGLQAAIDSAVKSLALGKDAETIFRESFEAFKEDFVGSFETMTAAIAVGRARRIRDAKTVAGWSNLSHLVQVRSQGLFGKDQMSDEERAASPLSETASAMNANTARREQIHQAWRELGNDSQRLAYLEKNTGLTRQEAEAAHRYFKATDQIRKRHIGAVIDAQYQYYVLGNEFYRDLANASTDIAQKAMESAEGVARMFQGMGFKDAKVSEAEDGSYVVQLISKENVGVTFQIRRGKSTIAATEEAATSIYQSLGLVKPNLAEVYGSLEEFSQKWVTDSAWREKVIADEKLSARGAFSPSQAQINVKTASGESLSLSVNGIIDLVYGDATNLTAAHEAFHGFYALAKEIAAQADPESDIAKWAKAFEAQVTIMGKSFARLSGREDVLQNPVLLEEFIADLMARGTAMSIEKMNREEGKALQRQYAGTLGTIQRYAQMFLDWLFTTHTAFTADPMGRLSVQDVALNTQMVEGVRTLHSTTEAFNEVYAAAMNADTVAQASEALERARKGGNVNRTAAKNAITNLQKELETLRQGEQTDDTKARQEALEQAIADYEEVERMGLERAAVAINKPDSEIDNLADVETIREYNEMMIARAYDKAMAAATTDEAKAEAKTTRDTAMEALTARVDALTEQVEAMAQAQTETTEAVEINDPDSEFDNLKDVEAFRKQNKKLIESAYKKAMAEAKNEGDKDLAKDTRMRALADLKVRVSKLKQAVRNNKNKQLDQKVADENEVYPEDETQEQFIKRRSKEVQAQFKKSVDEVEAAIDDIVNLAPDTKHKGLKPFRKSIKQLRSVLRKGVKGYPSQQAYTTDLVNAVVDVADAYISITGEDVTIVEPHNKNLISKWGVNKKGERTVKHLDRDPNPRERMVQFLNDLLFDQMVSIDKVLNGTTREKPVIVEHIETKPLDVTVIDTSKKTNNKTIEKNFTFVFDVKGANIEESVALYDAMMRLRKYSYPDHDPSYTSTHKLEKTTIDGKDALRLYYRTKAKDGRDTNDLLQREVPYYLNYFVDDNTVISLVDENKGEQTFVLNARKGETKLSGRDGRPVPGSYYARRYSITADAWTGQRDYDIVVPPMVNPPWESLANKLEEFAFVEHESGFRTHYRPDIDDSPRSISVRASNAIRDGRVPIAVVHSYFGAKDGKHKDYIDAILMDDYRPEWHHFGPDLRQVSFASKPFYGITEVDLFAMNNYRKGADTEVVASLVEEANDALRVAYENARERHIKVETEAYDMPFSEAIAAQRAEGERIKKERDEQLAALTEKTNALSRELNVATKNKDEARVKEIREELATIKRERANIRAPFDARIEPLKDAMNARPERVPATYTGIEEAKRAYEAEAKTIIDEAKPKILEAIGRKQAVKNPSYNENDAVSTFVGLASGTFSGRRYSITADAQAQAQREYDEVVAKYKNTEQWLKAPNGEPTNLNERQWVQVRTPSFKAWFGDWENDPANASKVVDENGEPRAVHHGSGHAVFYTFKKGDVGFHFGEWLQAFQRNYMTVDDEGVIRSFFINLKNPLVIDKDARDWNGNRLATFWLTEKDITKGNSKAFNLVQRGGADTNPFTSQEQRQRLVEISKMDTEESNAAMREFIEGFGYDGIIYQNEVEASDYDDRSFIAFHPNQVKSATDNVGIFSNGTNDIRYSITAEQDLAYKRAVEEGDTDIAMKMVREAAAKAMPNTLVLDDDGLPKVVWHTTTAENLKSFDRADTGIWFADKRDSLDAQWGEYKYPVFLNIQNMDEVNVGGDEWFNGNEFMEGVYDSTTFDGVHFIGMAANGVSFDSYNIRNPNQAKSAEVATYDDNGNLIPLSERFNEASNDIRYSIISKEGYERKREWAARRMAENKRIGMENGLTEEQADILENIASARHDLHTNLDSEVNGIADSRIEKLQELLNEASSLGLPSLELNGEDIDTIAILDEIGEEYDYNEEYSRIYSDLEDVNRKVEKWLGEIDNQYKTSYKPSGATRFSVMSAGLNIGHGTMQAVRDFAQDLPRIAPRVDSNKGWGDLSRTVPVVGDGTSIWKYKKGKKSKEAKRELLTIALNNIRKLDNVTNVTDTEAVIKLDGVNFLITERGLFHGAGRRLQKLGSVIARIGEVLNASVEIPRIEEPWHYRIAKVNFYRPEFVLITAKEKIRGGEEEIVSIQSLYSLNVKSDAQIAQINGTATSPFDDTSIAQLKAAWEELFKKNLEDHIAKAHSAQNVNQKLQPANIAYAQGLADTPLDVGDPSIVETDSNGTSRFSIATYENGGRDVLVNYLKGQVEKKSLTQKDADSILAELDKVYDICKRFTDDPELKAFGLWSAVVVETDNEGKPIFGVVRPNGDYAYNIDFSTVCKKRRPLNRIFAELVNRGIVTDENIGEFLAEDRIPVLQDIIKKHGLEVACALCFVDSKRYKIGEVAKKYSNMHNGILEMYNNNKDEFKKAHQHYFDRKNKKYKEFDKKKNAWKKPLPRFYDKLVNLIATDPSARVPVDAGDLISSEGLDNFVKKHPSIFNLYRSFGGVSKAKDAFDDVPYNNDIIRPFAHATNYKTPFSPRSLRSIKKVFHAGGVRVQSFSDFVPVMVFDYMQMFAEMAARGLPTHIYTKEQTFVKIFGNIGAKINMSLVPTGTGVAHNKDGSIYYDKDGNTVEVVANGLMRDKDGNVLYDDQGRPMYDVVDETFPMEEAFRLRVLYGDKGNVGTIFVGVSDEHIWAMLDDDRIDQIIPYHKSSLNGVVAALRMINSYLDYTRYQTTKDPSKVKAESEEMEDGEEVSEKDAKKGTVKKDFNFYADLEKTNDPRKTADNYLAWCNKHGYIPKFEKFSKHRNYYKLLADFRLYDNDGNYAPQTAVNAQYHEGVAQDIKEALLEHEAAQEALSVETNAIINEFVAETKRLDAEKKATTRKAKAKHSIVSMKQLTMRDLKSYDLGAVSAMQMAERFIENRARAEGRDISPNEVQELYRDLGVSIDPFTAKSIAKVSNKRAKNIDVPEDALSDMLLENIYPNAKGLKLGSAAARLARLKGQSEGIRAAQRVMQDIHTIQRIKREEFEATKGLRTPEFENEMGFSLTRTIMALNDAYGRATDDERLVIDARRAKRAKELEERIERELDADDPTVTFAEDEMSAEDYKRYLDIREALQSAGRKTRAALEAREEEKRKKREEARLANQEDPLGDGDLSDEELGNEMDEESDLIAKNFRSILNLEDPNEVVWFVQQFCAWKALNKTDVTLNELKDLSHDPIFVRDFAMTLANLAETLSNGMVYSRNREQIKKAIEDITAAKSLSSVRTRAIGVFIRIHEGRIRENRKEIIAGLRKFLKKKIIDGKNAMKIAKRDIDRKVTAEVEEEARMIRSVLAMGRMAVRNAMVDVEATISGFADKLQQEKENYRDFRKAQKFRHILNVYGGAKHMAATQLQQLAEETERYFNEELDKQAEKRLEKEEATKAVNDALVKALMRGREGSLEPGQHSSIFTKLADALDSGVGLFDVTMRIIAEQVKDPVLRAKAEEILQQMANHVHGAEVTERARRLQYQQRIEEISRKHYKSSFNLAQRHSQVISEELSKRISRRFMGDKELAKDEANITQRNRLTVGQVLQLKMSIQQEDYLHNAMLWNRDKDCIDAINAVLTDTDLAWAEDIQAFLNETFVEARDVYKDVTGYTVGTTPNYWPVKIRRSESGVKGTVRLYSDVTNILTPRVPHALDFDEHWSALQTVSEKLAQQAHMIGFAGHDQAVIDTLCNGEVRRAIRLVLGEKFDAKLQEKLQDVLMGPLVKRDQLAKIVSSFSGYFSMCSLGFNAMSMLRQTAGWPAVANEIGWRGTGKALARMIFDFSAESRAKWEFLCQHDAYNARYQSGFSPEIEDALRGNPSRLRATLKKVFFDWGMAPLRWMDKLLARGVCLYTFDVKVKKYIDQGLSTEDAWNRAALEAWSVIETSQQSSLTSNQYNSVNHSAWARLFNAMRSGPLQVLQYGQHNVARILRGDKEGWKNFLKYSCAGAVLSTILNEMVNQLTAWLRDDDDELWDEEHIDRTLARIIPSLVFGNLMAAPILGDAIELAAAKVAGTWHDGTIGDVPAVSFMTRTSMELGEAVATTFSDDNETLAREWFEVAKSLFAPLRLADQIHEGQTGEGILEE